MAYSEKNYIRVSYILCALSFDDFLQANAPERNEYMRIEDFINKEKRRLCSGCMACKDACPTSSIHLETFDDGFIYPVVNPDTCVNCNKCLNVCPVHTINKNNERQVLYSGVAKDIVKVFAASSGGVFGAIAEKLIEEGYYVCGAAWDSGMNLNHTLISTVEELNRLLKSKYVQSNIEGIYTRINALLRDGKKVFFVGTPCQVSALKNYTNNHENLLTADIICHGVPSQRMFNDYISYLNYINGGKVIDFSFRVKNNKFKHAHGYRYTYEKNGKHKTVEGIYSDSPYYYAFKTYMIFRESCYECKYATTNRVGDITLGDFWSIEKYDPKANSDIGVSLVISNSERGSEAIRKIDSVSFREYPLSYGIETNYSLSKVTKRPDTYDEIMEFYKENGFEKTAIKYFSRGKSLKYRIYWKIPASIRNSIRKMRGKVNV